MPINITTWNEFFTSLKEKEYFKTLESFIDKEYSNGTCFPKRENIFKAFELTPLKDVHVVLFGQDPYHEINQAIGLAFAVADGVKIPPSLRNIYKEIENEYDYKMDYTKCDLSYIAKQGVLMLNAILTVREHEPLSHDIDEYKLLFKDIIDLLNKQDHPILFLLWGGSAKKYKKYIKVSDNHKILEANHPSPLSANRGGWFGCNHFLKVNEFLKENNLKEIDWKNY